MLENLEPKAVYHFFEEICNIPHGSGNEKKLSDYILHFAQQRGLFCRQDSENNVLIKKQASEGYEQKPAVILQGHIDMVCAKNSDVKHDFEKDAIQLVQENGRLKAKGTTLGADNGIGAAYILAILDAKDISHPPLEAIFTTNEETGMNGANGFDASDLQGKTFLNLDSEEEGEFVISCCGGNKTKLVLPIVWEDAPEWDTYLLKVTGLKGGHSGTDIHLQRANANRLLARILFQIFYVYNIRLANIRGGEKDNAIPREAEAVLLLKKEDVKAIKLLVARLNKICSKEYEEIEESILFSLLPMKEKVGQCFAKETTEKLTSILFLLPYGIQSMDARYPDLVESSSNIGAVKTEENEIIFYNALRSSVESRKELLSQKIKVIAEVMGAEVYQDAEYPAWPAKRDSQIEKKCKEIYCRMYQKQPAIKFIHAGLECGIFSKKLSDVEMISFGPTITGAHSPDETVELDSVKRVWEFLLELLKS